MRHPVVFFLSNVTVDVVVCALCTFSWIDDKFSNTKLFCNELLLNSAWYMMHQISKQD